MRTAIVSPVPAGAPSGNATTIARFARLLAARGHEAPVVVAAQETRELDRALRAIGADVALLYHARRCGRFADAARRLGGVVVALGGTDLDQDLRDSERRDLILRAV
jgi:hypothetical protein